MLIIVLFTGKKNFSWIKLILEDYDGRNLHTMFADVFSCVTYTVDEKGRRSSSFVLPVGFLAKWTKILHFTRLLFISISTINGQEAAIIFGELERDG